jgi:hypothetical protein
MLKIDMTETDKSFTEVLKEIDRELSKEIINAVCGAIDNNKTYVKVAEFITMLETIDITCRKSDYLKSLEVNMDILIRYEDYELCAKAKKYIDALKEKKPRKKLIKQ